VCLYFVQLARATGALQQLEIVPMQLRRLRLVRASAPAQQALQSLFETGGRHFNTGVQAQAGGSWLLRW
jgi:poly-gamma-glutamate capsule biosynthesis protein CapA/YwtB (metallophosphatase superfamily)